jgi:hypothetical protein
VSTTELPAWRAVRDCVLGSSNNIFMRGTVIRRKRCPGYDWAPYNDAAKALPGARSIQGLGTVDKGDPEAHRHRQPFSGLVRGKQNQDGSWAWGHRKGVEIKTNTRHGVPIMPLWRNASTEPQAICWGEVRRRNERWASCNWPMDDDNVEPVNEPARQVLAYWTEHRDEIESLPALAWDVEKNSLNTLPDETAADDTRDFDDAPAPARGGHTRRCMSVSRRCPSVASRKTATIRNTPAAEETNHGEVQGFEALPLGRSGDQNSKGL